MVELPCVESPDDLLFGVVFSFSTVFAVVSSEITNLKKRERMYFSCAVNHIKKLL